MSEHPLLSASERRIIIDWLYSELGEYVDLKYTGERRVEDVDRLHNGRPETGQEAGVGPRSYWNDEINRYLHRAQLLGVNTALGQQALLKALATLEQLVEVVVHEHGFKFPEPGLPSGEVERR